MIQDKLVQKEFFKAAGVPLGDFKSVGSAADVIAAAAEVRKPLS
jgi:phosphoribosylaminoimidazole carboxylase (NCAIR synthetase)